MRPALPTAVSIPVMASPDIHGIFQKIFMNLIEIEHYPGNRMPSVPGNRTAYLEQQAVGSTDT